MNLSTANSILFLLTFLLVYIFVFKNVKNKFMYSFYNNNIITPFLLDIKSNKIDMVKYKDNKYVLGYITNYFVTYMFKKNISQKKQKQLLVFALHKIFEIDDAINIYYRIERLLATKDKKFVLGSKEGYNAALYSFNNKTKNAFFSSYIRYLNER